MLARDRSPEPDPPLLALRAEGGEGRGVGHLARCLALGQAWMRRGGACTLVSSSVPEPWAGRYHEAGASIVEPGTDLAADWWVVDGYDLTDEGRPAGAHLGRIDDGGISPDGPVEVVVDQNLAATPEIYAGRTRYAQLGTRYALMRQELVAAAARQPEGRRDLRQHAGPLHLVVALGGAPSIEVREFFDQAVIDLAGDDDLTIKVLRGSDDPGPEYGRADLALAATGSTSWELSLFAVPTVFVAVAPNQEPLGAALQRMTAGLYGGDIGATTPAAVATLVRQIASSPVKRAELSAAMAQLVDGRGADRVATRLQSALLDLRPVTADDSRAVHELNNEPTARAASFSSEPIAWEDHQLWFANRLEDPNSVMYVANGPGGQLVGLVRFAIDARVAQISVVVDPAQRGQGWGGALVDAGFRRFYEQVTPEQVVRVDALVKASNTASTRAFLDADFDPQPSADPEVLRYARTHAAFLDA